jgi:phage host-nuclease inhibitor protein Gam
MKITSWETVDQALARLATLERRDQRADGAAKARIQKIKEQLARVLKPLRRDFKRLTGQIEKWTFGHSDDLMERTRRLDHGAVRLYKTPGAIVSELSDEELVALMKTKGYVGYIRTVEEPNRVSMKDLTDEELAKIKCRRESHDEFQWQFAGETEWR